MEQFGRPEISVEALTDQKETFYHKKVGSSDRESATHEVYLINANTNKPKEVELLIS